MCIINLEYFCAHLLEPPQLNTLIIGETDDCLLFLEVEERADRVAVLAEHLLLAGRKFNRVDFVVTAG
jgi:hypothetical protein